MIDNHFSWINRIT